MFAARGILVSLAFFAVVYCFLSLLVVMVWQWMNRSGRVPAFATANVLFGMRMFPFVLAAAVTLFLAVPSFLLLEGQSPDEDLATLVLGGCAIMLFAAGLHRVWTAQGRTTRAVSKWLAGTAIAETVVALPAVSAQHRDMPPLLLVGVRQPRILISEKARGLLSESELRVAVRHEMEHVRSRDNFKKMFFNCTPFPGMASLERAWQEAAELAADEAAVASRRDALDLAAALIKLSRAFPPQATPALATGLVSVSGSVRARVERLLAWRGARGDARNYWRYAMVLAGVAIVGVAANFGPVLALTHRLTDRLVP
jgi:Zn-dependent protease with chaperone function